MTNRKSEERSRIWIVAGTLSFRPYVSAECGVAHVAASPGSRCTPMTVAADRTIGLEVSRPRAERAGGA